MAVYESLKDRAVLITGGARGLGREMALELLEAGCKVAVTSTKGELSDDLKRWGPDRFLSLVADVKDYAACEEAVAAVRSKWGACSILINNAGRGMRLINHTFNVTPAYFWESDPDAWRTIIETNVIGAFNMARAATPFMVTEKFGKIINISTSDQTMIRKGYSPYGPSKAALEACSRVWAQDLEGKGVDVIVYLPGGAADTDLLPPGGHKKGADGLMLPAAIIRRGIRWLCADESNGLTGRRYIARLWDESLPDGEAAAGAASANVKMPSIM